MKNFNLPTKAVAKGARSGANEAGLFWLRAPIVRALPAGCAMLAVWALAGNAAAAGVFNGSDARLSVNSSEPTDEPIAMSAWFKTADTDHRQVIASISLGTAAGATHSFELAAAGNDPGDPVQARARMNVPGDAETTTGYTSNNWHHAFCVFVSNTSRFVWIDGDSVDEDTLSRSVSTTINRTNIGAIDDRGTVGAWFNGKLAEVAIWAGSGVESMSTTEAELLAAGVRPNLLAGFTGNVVLYQPLRAGANEPDKVGPTLTNTNVTFDQSDHPRVIYPARQHYHRAQLQ